MSASDLLATSDAARQLGVHPSRVRALLVSGELAGFKLGERWVVEADGIRRRLAGSTAPGRSLEPANAWAALFLASGESVDRLTPDTRWRLRRLLDRQGLVGLSARLRRRARLERYQAHPGVLGQLSQRPEVVHTGISAAAAHGLDLAAGNELDAYVSSQAHSALIDSYALEPAGAGGNVSLRIPAADLWPFADGQVLAPLAAVALDLSEEADSRSARVGRDALVALDRQHLWRARSEGTAHAVA